MTTNAASEITLNSDMGESFALHSFGNDPALMRIIDVANVACGFHAGDPNVLEETVRLAHETGVGVGAHPGLPPGRRQRRPPEARMPGPLARLR